MRWVGFDVSTFLMDGSMLAGPSLNFSQAGKVTALEIAVTVLEFPESCVRIASMEYVTFCNGLAALQNDR